MRKALFLTKKFTSRKFIILKLSSFLIGMLFMFSSSAQTGQALNFDGVDDYISLPFVVQNSYTKEAWIKITSNDGATHNIISGSETAFYIVNGYLSAGHSPSYDNVQDPTQLSLNTWYHVTVTYDHTTGTMTLYKDAVVVATGSAPGYTDAQNYIGAIYLGTSDNFFAGNIDEVRIWSAALSSTQISAYSGCTLLDMEPYLTAHYNFNQGTASANNALITTLTDNTGASRNGTLFNFALNGSSSNWVSPGVTFTGPCAVLPIELSSFTAEKTANMVNLSWRMSSEPGATAYIIERSKDPNDKWHFVASLNGKGSVSGEVRYSYLDAAPEKGINYYRITQNNYNGSKKYSNIKSVKFDEVALTISVYPTLAKDKITISAGDNSILNTPLFIVDNAGRIVRREIMTQQTKSIDISSLHSGMYFLKSVKGAAQKFLKQ